MQEGWGVGGREEDFHEREESVEGMAGNLKMTSQVSKEERGRESMHVEVGEATHIGPAVKH